MKITNLRLYLQQMFICEEMFKNIDGCSVDKDMYIYGCSEDSCILHLYTDIFPSNMVVPCSWVQYVQKSFHLFIKKKSHYLFATMEWFINCYFTGITKRPARKRDLL